MLGQGVLRIVLAAWRSPTCPWRAVQGCIAQVNAVLVHACNFTARRPRMLARLVGPPLLRLQMRHGFVQAALLSLLPRRSGGCAGHVLPRLTIHLQAALQGLCIPLQSEGGRAMRVLMRACVHAEMRIGTRGCAECRCASTALLAGKRGLAAEARALVHSHHGPLSAAGASCLQALL